MKYHWNLIWPHVTTLRISANSTRWHISDRTNGPIIVSPINVIFRGIIKKMTTQSLLICKGKYVQIATVSQTLTWYEMTYTSTNISLTLSVTTSVVTSPLTILTQFCTQGLVRTYMFFIKIAGLPLGQVS